MCDTSHFLYNLIPSKIKGGIANTDMMKTWALIDKDPIKRVLNCVLRLADCVFLLVELVGRAE